MTNQFKKLHQLDKLIEQILYYTSGVLLLIMAIAIFYSVSTRYILNDPPLWSDEAPRAFFLWLTYIGIIVATKRGQNIRVTHFIDKVPPFPRVVIETIMHVLVLIMLLSLVWYNFPVIQLQLGGKMLSTGWSFVWVYLPVSVGCTLMIFYQSRLMIKTIQIFINSRDGET